MPDQPLRDSLTDQGPFCPHCGRLLYPYGAILEVWGIARWVKAWHCPYHGAVFDGKKAEDKSEAEL